MSLTRTKRTIKRILYLGLSFTLISTGFVFLSGRIDNVAAVDGTGPNLTANYLSSNESHPDTGWSDNTTADPENFVDYYIEVGNTNVPSEAGNLAVKVTLPETAGGDNVSNVAISTTTACSVQGCNTSPQDSTTVHLTSATSGLTYQAGSTKVTADLNQDGTNEYDGSTWADGITEGGINLGAFNGGTGKIQITFRAWVSAITS